MLLQIEYTNNGIPTFSYCQGNRFTPGRLVNEWNRQSKLHNELNPLYTYKLIRVTQTAGQDIPHGEWVHTYVTSTDGYRHSNL